MTQIFSRRIAGGGQRIYRLGAISHQFTVCAWVRVHNNRSGAYRYFMGVEIAGTDTNGYWVGWNSGNGSEITGSGGSGGNFGTAFPVDGSWFFVFLRRTGTTLQAGWHALGSTSWNTATRTGSTDLTTLDRVVWGNDSWDEWCGIDIAYPRHWNNAILTDAELNAESLSAIPVRWSNLNTYGSGYEWNNPQKPLSQIIAGPGLSPPIQPSRNFIIVPLDSYVVPPTVEYIPTIFNNTTGTISSYASNTGVGTVFYPATVSNNAIAFMLLTTSGQDLDIANVSLSADGTWTPMCDVVSFDASTDDGTARMFWRRCNGTEGGTNTAVTFDTTNASAPLRTGQIFTVNGAVDNGVPYEGFAFSTGSGNPATSNTTIITGDGRLAFRIFYIAEDNQGLAGTAPIGWTRAQDIVNGSGEDGALTIDYKTALLKESPIPATSRTGEAGDTFITFTFAVLPSIYVQATEEGIVITVANTSILLTGFLPEDLNRNFYILSVSPTSLYKGLTNVTITGHGFGASQGDKKVFIDSTEQTDIVSWGEEQIVFNVTSPNDWLSNRIVKVRK